MFASRIAHCGNHLTPPPTTVPAQVTTPTTARCAFFVETKSINKLSGLAFLGTRLSESGVINGYFLVRICQQ